MPFEVRGALAVCMFGFMTAHDHTVITPGCFRCELNQDELPVYRTFGGMEITEDFVDDLVDEWHDHEPAMPTSLEQFVMANTGWTAEEYDRWVRVGRLPE